MKTRMVTLYVGVAILSACGPRYLTTYAFDPPATAEGRHCINRCLEGQTSCEQGEYHLELKERELCQQEALARARVAFDAHVAEQQDEGKQQHKTFDDFYNENDCDQAHAFRTKINCDENYRTCYTNCGGRVTEHSRCVKNCEDEGR